MDTLGRYLNDRTDRPLISTQTSLERFNPAQLFRAPSYYPDLPSPVPSDGSTRTPSTARTAISSDTRSHPSTSSRHTSIGTIPTGISSLRGYAGTMDFGELIGLPCPFAIVGCKVSFHSDQSEHWYQHSLSHFGEHRPPKHALCVFCDTPFNDDDPYACWRRRMAHTAGHHRADEQYEKPDFSLLRYMWEKKLLRDEDYKSAIAITEKPNLEGLIMSSNDLPQPQKRYNREDDGIQHDLRKERRQRNGKSSNI